MRMPQRPPLGAGARHALRARALNRRVLRTRRSPTTTGGRSDRDRAHGGRVRGGARSTSVIANPHCSEPRGDMIANLPERHLEAEMLFLGHLRKCHGPTRCPLVVAVSVMHPPSCGSRSSAPRDGAPGEPSGLTRRAASVEGHVRHRVTSGLLSTRRWWRRALPRRRRGGGRTLAKAHDHIRDATALWFEVAPGAFIVIEDIRFPKPVKATVDRAGKSEPRRRRAKKRQPAPPRRQGGHSSTRAG